MNSPLWIGVVTLLSSAGITALVRKYAIRTQLIDHPNDRSSHTRPTPRGGGISIVVTSVATVFLLWAFGIADSALASAVLGGGIAVAWVGFHDDRSPVSVRVRMAIHFLASVWGVYCLGGLPPIQWGGQMVDLGLFGNMLGAVGLIWVLNLFNFMDGIDGIAASEAAFITMAAMGIGLVTGSNSAISLIALAIGSASLGFLSWNWPPAKIFMGDVGSGYLGYAIGVLAIADARENSAALFVWLILGGVFFVDATVTLVRRLIRRERVYEAHRSHAYQWLARRWKNHKRVTVAVLMVNLIWLFPCALLASLYPAAAVWLVLAALTPIVVAALVCGAGRPEGKAEKRLSQGTNGE